MKIKKIRDITLMLIDKEKYLAVSCDSCGGIGEKEGDVIKTSAEIVGRETAKTVLAELISIGAKPLVLSDGLAVEMNNTGKSIIAGIEQTLEMLKDSNVHLTGSTEDNMETIQTGMGITGIGIIKRNKLKYNITKSGYILAVIGMPLVGYDVISNPDKVMDIRDYEIIRSKSFIMEMIPVGSKGIVYEINELCKDNNLEFEYANKIEIDIIKSAGPSSCCVVTLSEDYYKELKSIVDKPVTILGTFK